MGKATVKSLEKIFYFNFKAVEALGRGNKKSEENKKICPSWK
jgi:hypothetical protein